MADEQTQPAQPTEKPVAYQKTRFNKKDLLFRFPSLFLFLSGTIIYIVDSFSKKDPSSVDLSGFGVAFKGNLSAFMFVTGAIVFLIPIALDVYSVWKNGKTNAG